MIIEVTWWQVVLLISMIASLIWAFGTLLLRSFVIHIDLRFKRVDDDVKAALSKAEEARADASRLRSELPLHYVMREDWIRFSSSIDKKLDQLRDRFDKLLEGQ